MTNWSRRQFLGAGGAAMLAARAHAAGREEPVGVSATLENGAVKLKRSVRGRWEGGGVSVVLNEIAGAIRVSIEAPAVALRAVTLTWREETRFHRVLND